MFEMMHKAIAAGMTDFTLYRVATGWQASSRWHSGTGWRVSIDKEAEIAIKGALTTERHIPDDGSDLV